MITKEQARSLAVCYNAFNATDLNSGDRDELLAVLVWGKDLLNTQLETGIELHPNEWLERIVIDADRKYYA